MYVTLARDIFDADNREKNCCLSSVEEYYKQKDKE